MARMPERVNFDLFVKADNGCWLLAQSCARWAADTRDRTVRDAFMAMAKEWSRFGLQEKATNDSEFAAAGNPKLGMVENS